MIAFDQSITLGSMIHAGIMVILVRACYSGVMKTLRRIESKQDQFLANLPK